MREGRLGRTITDHSKINADPIYLPFGEFKNSTTRQRLLSRADRIHISGSMFRAEIGVRGFWQCWGHGRLQKFTYLALVSVCTEAARGRTRPDMFLDCHLSELRVRCCAEDKKAIFYNFKGGGIDRKLVLVKGVLQARGSYGESFSLCSGGVASRA